MNNKESVLHWFDTLWNKKQPSIIAELMHPSAKGMTESGSVNGPEELKARMYDPFIAAFPDMNVEVLGCVAEGDEVAARWVVTATQKGALAHIPASNRRVRFSGISWFRFKDGQMVEGFDSYNLHGLAQFLSTGEPSATVVAG